jgi:hypothetical protein
MAGKTHSIYVKVLVNAADISDSTDTIGNIGLTYDEADVSTIANKIRQYLTGRGDAPIDLSGPFNNTAVTGAHVAVEPLNGTNTAADLEIQIGSLAAPTTGDPKFTGKFIVTKYVVNIGDEGLVWNSSFKPAAGEAAPEWGTVD